MKFTELKCPKCEVRFFLQSDFADSFRDKGRAFYCPNSYCSKVLDNPTMLYFPGGKDKLVIVSQSRQE